MKFAGQPRRDGAGRGIVLVVQAAKAAVDACVDTANFFFPVPAELMAFGHRHRSGDDLVDDVAGVNALLQQRQERARLHVVDAGAGRRHRR